MSMLPPLLLEMRAHAGQVFTELEAVNASVAATEARTATATSGMARGFNRVAGAGKVLGIGVAVGGAIVVAESTKMAAHFQEKMTLLETAAGESHSSMKLVSDGILTLAGDTGVSIDQLAEGMYTVEKSGNRGAEGLKILQAAAEGAKAENVDLGVATNALTSVMMSYHKTSKDAVSVQNEMIAGSGLAKTSMQNYASSLSSVLPVASSAGIGFDQVAGAIATLTQHGTSAEESTQELANTIRGLQAPNAVAQQAMQQLGLSVTDLATGLADPNVGLTGTIDKVTKAIGDKMGPSGLVVVDTFKKSQSATADLQTMLGKMPAGLKKMSESFLAGNMSQTDYRKGLKGLDLQGSTMGRQFATLAKKTQGFNDLVKSGSPEAQTFAGTLNKVMGGATGMNTALMLGGENMAYFKKATEEVSAAGKKNGEHISTWAKTQQNLNVQLSQAKEVLAAVGVKIGTAFIPVVSGALKGTQAFIGYMMKNPPLLYTLAGIFGGILVVTISAYIAKLVWAGITSVINFVKMTAAGVVWSVKTAISISQTLALWAMYGVEWVAGTAASIAETTALWAMYAGEWIAKSAATGATWLAGQVVTFAGAVAAGAAWVASTAGQLVVSAAAWVGNSTRTVGALAVQNGALLAQKAILLASAAWLGIVTIAQWAWNAAMDANPIGLIIMGIVALVAAIIWVATQTTIFQDAWQVASGFVIAVWTAISAFFVAVWNGIVNYVSAAIHNVASVISAVGNGISSTWSGMWSWIIGFVVGIWNGMSNFIGGAVNGIAGTIGRVFGAIGGIIRGAFDGVVGFVRGIFNNISGMVNGIIDGINSVASMGAAIGIHVPKIGHLPSLDVGGTIPGATGQPVMMIGHGREEVLSVDMLSGRAPIRPDVVAAVERSSSSRSSGSGAARGTTNNVTVNATTNASPERIAKTASWELRRLG
jgi:TP901 family phage tail tape measure protein